jgi:iron(III) transport system substrate-binding protein
MQVSSSFWSHIRPAVLAAHCLLTAISLMVPARAAEQDVAEIEKAALKEGTLVWYGAMRSEHITELANLFMKTYPGMKVETVHLVSGDMAARVMMEQRGRRFNADFLSAAAFATSQLKAEGMLVPFVLPSSVTKDLAKGSYDPEGYWLSQYALTFPVTYNKTRLAAGGLAPPTSYEDFTKPEWRGKFAISSDYYDWYQGLTEFMGPEKAKDLTTRIAANQPLVRGASGSILQLLVAGEFAATFHIYGYNSYEEKKAGGPIEIVNVSPVVAGLQTGGIAKNAPHPNAAKLFQIFMTRADTQQFISSKLGRTSTHTKVDNIPEVWDPSKVTYQILDPDKQVKSARAFREEYNAIFGLGKSRR